MRVLRRVLVAACLAVVAAPASAQSLADTLIAAYRNSNLLESNRAVLRAADEDVAQAMASLRPAISVEGGGSYSNQRLDRIQGSVALQAQITLYDSGRGRQAVEASKEVVLATRQALVDLEQQVLLNAVRAHVGVRLNEDIVALRRSNLTLIGQELRAAQDRFDVGETTRTDVAQAEARLAASRSELASAEGDLAVAREQYNLAVGRMPGRLAALPRPPALPGSLEEARRIALAGHPRVRQAQHQVTAADLGIQRAQAAMRPTVTARAGRTFDIEGGRPVDSASLSFNQTLYGGGQLSALYRQAIARRDQERATLLQTSAEIGAALGEAWAGLRVGSTSIAASDEQVRAAQTAFEGVREEARLGARTTLDVLDAEQALLAARVQRVSAEANRAVQAYAVLAAMGLLTAEHLGLGIPTYDPAAYYNAVRNAPATSSQGRRLDRVLDAIGRNR
ncbi:MAG TPA: TolC family outer membrane protein [Paracoccaceae bacterium]|nr:TolC family outer membrane protein [Paracoccaceae bacterium]HMO72467.1 TolC family outer membrane protein [Paracoccaceae bacterium]